MARGHWPTRASYCSLLPWMLPPIPPATAPMAAPVHPLPPEIAAMPAPAPAPIAAPLIVPCCCGVIFVHPMTAIIATIAANHPYRLMSWLLAGFLKTWHDNFEPDR